LGVDAVVRVIPSKKVCEEFSLLYELEGAQKAVDFLTGYYRIEKMKIVVDGRKVSKNCLACYEENVSYFTRYGLRKRIVLHEFYHHLVFNEIIIPLKEGRQIILSSIHANPHAWLYG